METKADTGTAKARLSAAHASLIVGAAATVGLVAAASQMPFVRERQAAPLSLAELEAQARQKRAASSDSIFLYHLGRRMNEAGRFADALPILEQAAGLEPTSARVRDEWARAAVGAGRPSAAFAQLMQFRAANPSSADGYRLLGKFHVTQKAYAAARTSLEKAVALAPGDAASWSLLANCLLGMGDTSNGEAALDRALALRPSGAESAPNWLQRASLQAGLNPRAARAAFENAVRFAPENPEAHREYARFLIAQGSVDEAAGHAQSALALDPEDGGGHYLLGRALMAGGRWQEAVTPLENAARLMPHDPLPAGELMRAAVQRKDAAQAALWRAELGRRGAFAAEMRIVADKVRARPTDRGLRRQMAQLLARMGDVPGCVRESALALRMSPDSPRPLIEAARALRGAGRSDDALPLVRQSLGAQTAVNPDGIELLGDLLLEMGRLHEAAVQYQRISDLRPDRVEDYRRRLADAAAELRKRPGPADRLLRQAAAALSDGNPTQAEDLAQKAVAAQPQSTRALRFLLARQFARRASPAHREAARQTALRLASLSPEDGISRALLAILLLESGSAALGDVTRLLDEADPDPAAAGAIWYARGLMAQADGDTAAARERFERAAKFDPQFGSTTGGTDAAMKGN